MWVYPWYFSEFVSTKTIGRIAGNHVVKKSVIYIEKDIFHMSYDEKSANDLGEYFFKKVQADEKFTNQVVKNIYSLSEKLMVFCDNIGRMNLEKSSNERLLKIYSDYAKKLNELRMWGWVPVFLDGFIINYLSDYLNENLKLFVKEIDRENIGDYYSILSSSEKMSEVQTEEQARLFLLSKLEKNKNWSDIKKIILNGDESGLENYKKEHSLLKKHLHDYGWLTYAYSGPKMTLKYLLKNLTDNINEGDTAGSIAKIRKHYQEIKQEKKKIIKKLTLSAKLQYLFRVSSEFMFIKDYRKGIYQKSYVAMDAVLGEMAKRLNMSLKEVKFLIYDDLHNALLKKQSSKYKKIAQMRLEKCCIVTESGKMHAYQGAKCEAIVAEIIKNKQSQKNEDVLRGMVAYKGHVQGVARIVLIESDVPKVKVGDILVSSATNPNLISAMKKAAAFVTDMGGITSHAAIVSRELKKPCVVGTKYATDMIKDGDIVEVDAEQGIVKIIKKL